MLINYTEMIETNTYNNSKKTLSSLNIVKIKLITFIHSVRSLRRNVLNVSLRYILRPAACGANSGITLWLSDVAPKNIA